MKRSPGSSQRLDLFIKVLRVLCPNLTDASLKLGLGPQEPCNVLMDPSFSTDCRAPCFYARAYNLVMVEKAMESLFSLYLWLFIVSLFLSTSQRYKRKIPWAQDVYFFFIFF
jgi:hypothetical protein